MPNSPCELQREIYSTITDMQRHVMDNISCLRYRVFLNSITSITEALKTIDGIADGARTYNAVIRKLLIRYLDGIS